MMRQALALTGALSLFATAGAGAATLTKLPYAGAGLDERAAAGVLLDRFTYGVRPGDLDRVVEFGLDRWLEQQLAGALPEPELAAALERFEALRLDDQALVARYPNSSQLSAHVRRFYPGVIPGRDEIILDFSVVTAKLDAWRAEHGVRSQDVDLRAQVLGQKVVRAVTAENQLREVLTDFWQNHFFTSPIAFNARVWILPFERDALRPNALGRFDELLGAAVAHPALLQYYQGLAKPAEIALDRSTMGMRLIARGDQDTLAARQLGSRVREEIAALEHEDDLVLAKQFWSPTGPNEPFARALLSLQTLGPDGPQTAADVTETARVFTGWGAAPVGPSGEWYRKGFTAGAEVGFVRAGSFLFRADQHDAGAKRILGRELPPGGGIEEGHQLLDLLAAHAATARHIAHKLAVRFVSDEPSAALVDRLASAFAATQGDVAAVVRAIVESPEFWAAGAARSKVKTPLEYAASALRASGATLDETGPLVERIAAMGQPLYAFLEPTGFPDRGAYWLDSASLLARIEFARDLAANAIDGIAVAADAGPAVKARAALEQAAHRVLPGRRADATIATLAAALDEPLSASAATGLVLASPEFQLR